MKIVVDKDIPFIEGRIHNENEVVYLSGNKFTADIVADADALIIRTRTICDELLLKGSKVKLIATATIGTDHIDIPWCEQHGIIVRSAPGCNAPGVAQYVLSSLFNTGFDPSCHTLGIVGFGNVGGIIGKWAREMGIKILVCDPLRKEAGLNDVDYLPLQKTLQESDAVTLHVPLTFHGKYATNRFIGKEELSLMKDKAMIVNSSRGGVVDERCLKESILSGKIRTVVDVWENEPEIDRELLELADIATPHIAGYSFEGKKRGTMMVLKALESIMSVKVNYDGLECFPDTNQQWISREIIQQSYNPEIDSVSLKMNPDRFEELRNHYEFRHEPMFFNLAKL